MLWKTKWRPEIVLQLMGGMVAVFFVANVAVELLLRAGVRGFHTLDSTGSVLLATLGFHGTVIVAGILFLKFHSIGWREIAGLKTMRFIGQIQRVVIALAVIVPVMFALKVASMHALEMLGWPVEDQRAVELLLDAKTTGMKIYLAFFAVAIAPTAEEIFFRGFLFSSVQKLRNLSFIRFLHAFYMPTFAAWLASRRFCRLSGYIAVSFLFALVHDSAPIFLPLFAFALVLTWLYETTGGLLAPVMTHGIFNAANLAVLFLAEKYQPVQ